jgi:hypothetical protein
VAQVGLHLLPFALCSKDGRERVLAAYRDEPDAGARALMLEHIAVALNPRQGLAAGERLSAILAATGQHHDVTDLAADMLDRMPWHVYEVRRVIRPLAGDPARAASASRSLRALASGTRAEMTTALRDLARIRHAETELDDGIERAWLRRRGTALPTAEHFLVAAPAGPQDKGAPAFRRPGRQPFPGICLFRLPGQQRETGGTGDRKGTAGRRFAVSPGPAPVPSCRSIPAFPGREESCQHRAESRMDWRQSLVA